MKIWILVLFVFAFAGCIGLKNAVNDFEACMGNMECQKQVELARDMSYNATHTVMHSWTGIPSLTLPDLAALLVSNIVAFVVGVAKGRRGKA